ncbi:MAG: HEPN domain-containing protein [Chloroflexi bacterium]|nr:HEPN domain-containing protein [Chloroflexota bacterium]
MAQGCVEEVQKWLGRARVTLAAADNLEKQSFFLEAISRTYYAMFYAARALLLSRGVGLHKHSAVIAAFGKQFAREGLVEPRLHRAFVDAFKERNRADYEVVEEPARESVQKRLELAEEFVNQVEDLIKQHLVTFE